MRLADFPRYDSYKSVNVDWISEVPSNWQVLRVQDFSSFNDDVIRERDYRNRQIRYVDISGVDATSNTYTFENLGFNNAPSRARRLVKAGDTAFSTVRPYLKAVATIDDPEEGLVFSTGFAIIRPGNTANSRFVGYILRNNRFIEEVSANSVGASYPAINASDLVKLHVPLPPLPEQHAIAAFLDEKCSKIDEAVRIREEQIALLRERRQILIQQTVTRGLNPDAPMKDSGIDWIGQIPAHWKTNKISHVARVDTGSTPSRSAQQYWGGKIPWIKTGEIDYSTIYKSEETITELGLRESSLRLAPPGTLLMAMYGQGVTRGRVAILGVAATYNQACCGISFKDEIGVNYAQNYFIAAYPYFRDAGNETSQMNLSLSYIASLKILNPPKKEQLKINEFIDKNERQITNTISIKQFQIAALKEYKTVLINAAVTGKIKVT